VKLDPKIIGVLLEVGRVIWDAVSNKDKDTSTAVAIAEAALKAAVEEAKRRAEQLGLAISFIELDLAAQRMIAGIRAAAAKPTISIPSLLDIEEIAPDGKLEATTVAEVEDVK
jgi:hypothetical protein